MLGTLYNAVAVAVGASAGLALRGRLPESLRAVTFQALGLFTVGLAVLMVEKMQDPFAVFLALVLGAGVGQTLQLHRRLERWTAGAASGGLVQAVLLFCVGAMTVVGCIMRSTRFSSTVRTSRNSRKGFSTLWTKSTN